MIRSKTRRSVSNTALLAVLSALLLCGEAANAGAGIPAAASAAAVTGVKADAKLTMRALPRVEQSKLTITFDYEAAKAGKLQVKLLIKPEGSKDYRTATLDKQDASLTASAGVRAYRINWNKAVDKIVAGQSVDLRLVVTDSKGKADTYDMRGYKSSTKQQLRDGVDDYLIYYGQWTDELVASVAGRYELIVLDARAVKPQQAARLRAGKDPHDAGDDTLVFGYVSVGEDLRTNGLTPEQMRKDKRFVLDGTGPSVDPRAGGPYPDGGEIPASIDVKGKPTNGGFAPFYLNDNFVTNGTGRAGVPDVNANFNGAFVNPGHPAWYETLLDMKLSRDRVPGIRELLSTNYGEGFGLDGLFLDTLDTAAPNGWTDASSWNQSEFEWTAPGTQQMVKKLSEQYPGHLLLANRGLFFYHPDHRMYAYTLRPYVDFVMYESYRLDSNAGAYYAKTTFHDNKYNFAQKVLAEADRPDGYRVLSLGYAEGPGGAVLKRTLQAKSTAQDQRMLQDDLHEASSQLGMVHYISDAGLTSINGYVKDRFKRKGTAPTWGSTQTPPFGQPFDRPREGVQHAAFVGEKLVVQWDVAHGEARPITYTLYVKQGGAFDFSKDLKAQSALVVETLKPSVPANYAGAGDRSSRYPYEAVIEGLDPVSTYEVLIRAKSASGVYEGNRRTVRVGSGA